MSAQLDARLVTGHPAAGAGRQARNRPVAARRPLQTSHDRTLQVMAEEVRRALAGARAAVVATDANQRTVPVPGGRWVQHAPDFVGAFPPHGWAVRRVAHVEVVNPVEPGLHPGLLVTFTFGRLAETVDLTVLFVNAGRGTQAAVERLWGNVAHAAHRADFVIAVEVGEGDKGYDDWSLARRALHAFRRLIFRGHHEVILRNPASPWQTVGPAVVRRAGRSVRHWSPSRPVTVQSITYAPKEHAA